MKSIFEDSTRTEIIGRINSLSENSKSQWGKMNIYQMIKHCTLWDEMMLEGKNHKRGLISILFGRLALRSVMKNESPLAKNTPTIPDLIIKETGGDISSEKNKWISHIRKYENFSTAEQIHPFFGRMTKDQIGKFVYKHADHHLRQFNS